MIAEFRQAFALINFQVFLFSMVLFFIGYTLAPMIYFKNIKTLLAYPLWIARKLDKLANKEWKFVLLFLFIFGINAFSLFVDLLSGKVPGLPFIFAIWTGLNIGVVTYHSLEGKFYYASLFNPVALFELPAAFIAFALAIQYNFVLLNYSVLGKLPSDFNLYFNSFVYVVLPLLLIAGIIETFAIKMAQKIEKAEKEAKKDHSSDKKEP